MDKQTNAVNEYNLPDSTTADRLFYSDSAGGIKEKRTQIVLLPGMTIPASQIYISCCVICCKCQSALTLTSSSDVVLYTHIGQFISSKF